MATIHDILKKNTKNKEESKPFEPETYRAWDYVNKEENKGKKNLTQTKHKPNTNLTQTAYKPNTNLTHVKNKLNTQPNTQPNTNLTQTQHKPNTNSTYSELVGLQKIIMFFIYLECKKSRSTVTGGLTTEYIANSLKIRNGSIKTTLQRLEKKELINTYEFKNGRGGWVKYELQDSIYREMLQHESEHKPNTNPTQTQHKSNTQPNTQPNTNPLSSSSLSNLNTTTSDISQEWLELNIDPLKEYGFNDAHKKQLATGKSAELGFDMVQDSILFYAFDLTHNNKLSEIKKTPVELFMSYLRRDGLPYPMPYNYKSPRELAIDIYNENKRQEQKRIRKAKEEGGQIEFEIWLESLSDDETQRLIKIFNLPKGLTNEGAIKGHLKKYYQQEVRGKD